MVAAPRTFVQGLALAALGLLTGCTALLDTDTAQCDSDADCAGKGEAFKGLVCSPDKVCAERSCTNQTLCRTRSDEQGYCVASKCQTLVTKECARLWPPPPYRNQIVELTGFMASLSGVDQTYGEPQFNGAAVALREIEQNTGLPQVPNAVSVPRSFAMLVCDQANWQAATDHLVKDLHVPAIVGASYSSVTQNVTTRVQGDGVLVFSQAATAPLLNTVDSTGLLWRTAPSDVYQVETVKRLHDRVVSTLKAQGIANPKVLITNKEDTAGQQLFNAARTMADPNVVKNPAPALSFGLSVRLPDSEPKADAPEWIAAAERVLVDQPDIILHLGTAEFAQAMLETIEQRWPAGQRKPWYVLTEGGRVPELLDKAAKNPGWRLPERTIGAAPGARNTPLWQEFVGAHRSFPRATDNLMDQQPGNLAEYAYDAVYLLAYAVGRTRVQAPTGDQLVSALREVSCKRSGAVEISGSATRYAASYAAVSAAGSCVDYKGPSGDLDFNPDVGEAPSDQSVWCLRKTTQGYGFEPALAPFYSSATGTLATESLDFSKLDWCPAAPF